MAKGPGSGKKWVILNVLEMGRVDLYFFTILFFEKMYFPLFFFFFFENEDFY